MLGEFLYVNGWLPEKRQFEHARACGKRQHLDASKFMGFGWPECSEIRFSAPAMAGDARMAIREETEYPHKQ
jgi:hypothetical protein